MKCLAIDDEPLALNLVSKFASKIPYIELLGTFESPYEAVPALKNESVDLIFMDINMPDISGIQFLRSMYNPPLVIFTTAYEQYALEGFELNALDYLLKPFAFERFLKAVDKAYGQKTLMEKSNKSTQPLLQEEINVQTENLQTYIFVKSEYQMIKINLQDILYIEGLKDYIKIYLQGQTKPILTLNSLKTMDAMLDETRFIRVHRSFIINISRIQSIHKFRIKIAEREIPIGDSYQDNFHKRVVEGNL